MKRVTGIGGVFFKANNADEIRDWYKDHLGINIDEYGGASFEWREKDNPEKTGTTAWSVFPKDTKYFDPSKQPFMINYRVENLVELLDVLRQEGVQVEDKIEEYEYGKFGWIIDPEGNKIELWEPPTGE